LRSRAAALLLGVCALGAGALALVAAGDERTLAFTTNVRVAKIAAVITPGQQACQRGVGPAASFDTLELFLGTGTLPGPPLRAEVRELRGGRPLGQGRIPPGARDNSAVRVRLDRTVRAGPALEVCFRNEGTRNVGLYGGPDREVAGTAVVGDRPGGGDIRIGFLRSEPRSALSLVPRMFERASLLRPDPVGAWTFWLLLAVVAAGVPLLLAAALRSAEDEQDPA
jgi:hypothetical protein